MRTISVSPLVICLLSLPCAGAFAAPTVTATAPVPAGPVSSLSSISVTFSEAVSGVDADDLLINAVSAAGITGSGAGPYVFTFTQPAPGMVSISWDFDHGIAGLGSGAFVPEGGWTYTLTDTVAPAVGKIRTSVAGQEMDAVVPAADATVGVLTQAEVTFSEPVTGVNAGDLLVNGTSAPALTGDGAGPYVFTFPQPAAGTVSFSWAGGHGIVDGAANAFSGAGWSVTLAAGAPGVVITEFLAANASGLTDENADTSDWIELYNSGAAPVNLAGWSLTSDADEPGQWIFPARTLNAGSRLVVFASGKDRKPAAGNLHTNFSLNANGGYLALRTSDSPRTVATAFVDYPSQRYNYSYGPQPSDGALRYFSPPTPNAVNSATGLASVAAKPTPNVGRGFFSEPVSVILSAGAGSAIRYTLDGSDPLATSTLYSGPINIAATTVLRAANFPAGQVPSETVTHSYLFLDQVFNQPSPPYDNPANANDNTNPPLPTVSNIPAASGGVQFPVTWGTTSTAMNVQIANITSTQVPADYGMDPEIYNDTNKYDDTGAINAATGITNMERIKKGLRDLPMLSVVMKMDDMFGLPANTGIYSHSTTKGTTYEKPCSVEFLLPDGTAGFATTCGIRIHGNASREPIKSPKHGFKFNFKGTFGAASLDYQLFPDTPAREFDDLIVRADFNSSWTHWDFGQRSHGTRIRDAFSKDTFRSMGRMGSHHRYVNLFINGMYWGTYDITEQENNGFASAHFGGTKNDYDVVEQGALKSGTLTTYSAMVAVASPIDNPKYEQMKQYVDVPWLIDYMLLHFYEGHEDWGGDINKNWYAVRNNKTNGKFRYLPWDMENLLWATTVDRTTVTLPPSGLHTKLVTNAQYRLDFADRIHRHMVAAAGALLPAANITRWNKWRSVLTNAIACEAARWGDYRRDVHQYSGGPYPLYKWNVDWITEMNRMASPTLPGNYFNLRTTTVLAQLRTRTLYPQQNAPEFRDNTTNALLGSQLVTPGTQVKLVFPAAPPANTVNTGTFYFTTDGSDPRVYYDTTGQRTPTAQAYSVPVTINAPLTLKARTLSVSGTTWSALMEATFTMGSPIPPIRITEIHYNPPNGQGGSAAEFIELQNIGTLPVDIGGYYLEGVDFVFPTNFLIGAGARIVLANNGAPATFAATYPGVSVAGYFGGSLSNSGERLALVDRNGGTVVSADYNDQLPFPVAADGDGYSLEIIDPDGDPDSAYNWKASAIKKGTPGAANSAPAGPPVLISEFLTINHGAVTVSGQTPQYVELFNPGAGNVDVSNWIVQAKNSGSYTFPPGSSLPAGYSVVYFNAAAPLTPAGTMPMWEENDEVLLRTGSGVVLDGVRYGPQAANYAFGRVGGNWTLTVPTRGAANVAAATTTAAGNLRLNEWLADPPPGADDWLELYNTHATLPLVMTGMHFSAGPTIFRLKSLSAVAPLGWAVFACEDHNNNPDTLDFKLPSSGATLTLRSDDGTVFDSLTYGPQTAEVTQGRLPDGTGAVTTLAYPSPNHANHTALTGSPVLNEVLLINRDGDNDPWGRRSPWIELKNPTAGSLTLDGWSLRPVNGLSAWPFPRGVSLPPGGLLPVWCNVFQAFSSANGPHLNSALSLDDRYVYWGLELINPAGQVADRITWGRQLTDRSVGRLTDNSWALLSTPTRGAANSTAAVLGPVSAVKINEWHPLAQTGGIGEFFELYNTDANPVPLASLWLSDEPSEAGRRKWRVPALSFIAGSGYASFTSADRDPRPTVVNFHISGDGEALRVGLNDAATTAVDFVGFGAASSADASQGRLPDGTFTIGDMIPTPGAPNGSGLGPVFSVHPQSVAVPLGAPVTLTAAAAPPVTYRWQRNNLDISSATAATLSFAGAGFADDATYTCTATNGSGSATSLPATLTVLSTFSLWTAAYGAGAGFADPDHDGLDNYSEFLAGTNPLAPASEAERAAAHQFGRFESIAGTDYLTMELRLSRRAAYSELAGKLSPDLNLWSPAPPPITEILGADPNGDQHVKLKYAIPAGSRRQFLRLSLTP